MSYIPLTIPVSVFSGETTNRARKNQNKRAYTEFDKRVSPDIFLLTVAMVPSRPAFWCDRVIVGLVRIQRPDNNMKIAAPLRLMTYNKVHANCCSCFNVFLILREWHTTWYGYFPDCGLFPCRGLDRVVPYQYQLISRLECLFSGEVVYTLRRVLQSRFLQICWHYFAWL